MASRRTGGGAGKRRRRGDRSEALPIATVANLRVVSSASRVRSISAGRSQADAGAAVPTFWATRPTSGAEAGASFTRPLAHSSRDPPAAQGSRRAVPRPRSSGAGAVSGGGGAIGRGRRRGRGAARRRAGHGRSDGGRPRRPHRRAVRGGGPDRRRARPRPRGRRPHVPGRARRLPVHRRRRIGPAGRAGAPARRRAGPRQRRRAGADGGMVRRPHPRRRHDHGRLRVAEDRPCVDGRDSGTCLWPASSRWSRSSTPSPRRACRPGAPTSGACPWGTGSRGRRPRS